MLIVSVKFCLLSSGIFLLIIIISLTIILFNLSFWNSKYYIFLVHPQCPLTTHIFHPPLLKSFNVKIALFFVNVGYILLNNLNYTKKKTEKVENHLKFHYHTVHTLTKVHTFISLGPIHIHILIICI